MFSRHGACLAGFAASLQNCAPAWSIRQILCRIVNPLGVAGMLERSRAKHLDPLGVQRVRALPHRASFNSYLGSTTVSVFLWRVRTLRVERPQNFARPFGNRGVANCEIFVALEIVRSRLSSRWNREVATCKTLVALGIVEWQIARFSSLLES